MCLEVGAEAQGDEVAVIHRAEITTEKVGVVQAGGVGVLVFGIQAQTDGFAALFEVGARTRGVPLDVMGCLLYTSPSPRDRG